MLIEEGFLEKGTHMFEEKSASSVEKNGREIISLKLSQLHWPSECNDKLPLNLLCWLISPDLSGAAAAHAARRYIHVVAKPRTKKDDFVVIGGVMPYFILLNSAWSGDIQCILVSDCLPKDFERRICNDLSISLFGLKGGALAIAAKAALFVRLLELGEAINAPSSFKLSARHFGNGKGLLKEIIGFDFRSYKRADKTGMAPEIIEQIESILGLPPSSGGTASPEKES